MVISKPNQALKTAVKSCYPDYKGRKFKVSSDIPRDLESYWSGGSRTYYCFYQPSTGRTFDTGSNHPVFEANKPRRLPDTGLPEGILIVAHSFFCGKDMGITVYGNKVDAEPLLDWKKEAVLNIDGGDGAVRITKNEAKNGIELRFPAKPEREVLTALKAAGWKWSPRNTCWYKKDRPGAVEEAKNLNRGFLLRGGGK